jgi:hypothetical protein
MVTYTCKEEWCKQRKLIFWETLSSKYDTPLKFSTQTASYQYENTVIQNGCGISKLYFQTVVIELRILLTCL